MTPDEIEAARALLREMLDRALTPEFSASVRKQIAAENARFEREAAAQRMGVDDWLIQYDC